MSGLAGFGALGLYGRDRLALVAGGQEPGFPGCPPGKTGVRSGSREVMTSLVRVSPDPP